MASYTFALISGNNTFKDEYPMPVTNMLVDSTEANAILSFIDEHFDYNKIFNVEDDISKTTFKCFGSLGNYKWVVIPFGLKNVIVMHLRAMNSIFHDMIN